MVDTLTFSCEVDGLDVELTVGFQAKYFSGTSSAWFTVRELADFLEKLAEYPLGDASSIELRGGIWDCSASRVVQDLVSFLVRPFGRRGQILVEVRLTSLKDGKVVTFSSFGSFVVSYQEIDQIRSALNSVIDGSQATAVVLLQDFA